MRGERGIEKREEVRKRWETRRDERNSDYTDGESENYRRRGRGRECCGSQCECVFMCAGVWEVKWAEVRRRQT